MMSLLHLGLGTTHLPPHQHILSLCLVRNHRHGPLISPSCFLPVGLHTSGWNVCNLLYRVPESSHTQLSLPTRKVLRFIRKSVTFTHLRLSNESENSSKNVGGWYVGLNQDKEYFVNCCYMFNKNKIQTHEMLYH